MIFESLKIIVKGGYYAKLIAAMPIRVIKTRKLEFTWETSLASLGIYCTQSYYLKFRKYTADKYITYNNNECAN